MTVRPALLFLAVLVVATSSLPPSAEAGGDRSARRLRRSALAHYRDGDYADAARDFRAAYEIEAHAELLYALGQSLRLAGDCAGAIDAYQDFLVTGPEEEQASAAREKIEVCRQVLAPTAPPPPAASPAPRPAARALAPPRSPARPAKSWARDPAGGLLLAGGVVATAAGIWVIGDADAGGDDPHDQRTAGAVLIGAGGGLVAAAVIRYALVRQGRRDDDPPPISAAIDPRGGGGALWVTGRF